MSDVCSVVINGNLQESGVNKHASKHGEDSYKMTEPIFVQFTDAYVCQRVSNS